MAHPSPTGGGEIAASVAVIAGVCCGVLWLGGAASALMCGHALPHSNALSGVLAFAHLGSPSVAWHAPVGPAVVYWAVTLTVVALAVGLAVITARAAETLSLRIGELVAQQATSSA